MSRRIDMSRVVLRGIENGAHDRCVELFRRPDGSFGFEDAGAWMPVAYHTAAAYSSMDDALSAAIEAVVGLGGAVEGAMATEATWRAQRPMASRSSTRRRATGAIPPCC